IAALHPEYGTMSVRTGDVTIEVPFSGHAAGESIYIAISAHDILLATEELRITSARNVLPGKISEIQERELNLYIKVDCGIPMIVLITKHAAEQLALKQGQHKIGRASCRERV